jgi:catalase
VANNSPVLFVRDPTKFPHPDYYLSQNPDPSTHLTHADDSIMFWDYLSQNPALMHQDMALVGDRGIPRWISIYARLPWPQHQQWVYCQLHMKSHEGTQLIAQEDSVSYCV